MDSELSLVLRQGFAWPAWGKPDRTFRRFAAQNQPLATVQSRIAPRLGGRPVAPFGHPGTRSQYPNWGRTE